jgi:hypothetical protein
MNLKINLSTSSNLFLRSLILFLTFCTLIFIPTRAHSYVPSDNRADANFRRHSNLDGNNVRVTVQNNGLNGWETKQPDLWGFEYPKNTKREYIVFVSIWLGGEVINDQGETVNIVDISTTRSSPSGNPWSLQPVPGFLNPDHPHKELARSDDPTSWPRAADGGWRDKQEDRNDPGWIGSWNGFFGKNVFNADLEMYYRCSDDLYNRGNYIPDTTDVTRGGLGLLMDERAMAWTQILINDVVFFIDDIKNDGTKRVNRTVFTMWIADLVGGDSNDDKPFVDLQTSIAFFTDNDRVGTDPWGNNPVGLGAVKFIETPGNQVNGIDDDGDADAPEHASLLSRINGDPAIRCPLFTENDFGSRSLRPGDKIVLIDSSNFERRVIAYPQGGGTVKSLGHLVELPADGITLTEDTLFNSIDDDLDGLIDERLSLHLHRFNDLTGTVVPVRYINYLSFNIGDTIKRGFIVAGTGAAQNYQNVAPMIDESRDDGFDNDNDWDPFQDDVGLDGAENTGDEGEGDGKPTSGTGTDLPGEPNIDKTDVSETDLLGITGTVRFPAFSLNFSTIKDRTLMMNYMRPGYFVLPRPTSGEFDITVSSGYFPLDPGERQRMAVSVAMDDGGPPGPYDFTGAINKQKQARIAYEADYRFAQAPLQVTVTAVPGDGKVTLYWDKAAEESVDNFIKRLDYPNALQMAHDFEGYRIYRSTDAAMLDPLVITDGQGNKLIRRPIAQFDLKDGVSGYQPIDIYGVKYWLGDDSGLQHSYVDSGLTNGQRYFYAVTAYDYGFVDAEISPTETPIRIDVNTEGEIVTGTNVAVVRPRAPVAGYLPAEVDSFIHVSGTSTGKIAIKVVDPRWIKPGHEYEITFEDTLIRGTVLDVLTTKNFSLMDLTADTLFIDKSKNFAADYEQPIIDGFRLIFNNEDKVKIDPDRAKWSSPDIYKFQFSPVQFLTIKGVQNPYDYLLVMGDVGISTSKDTLIGNFPLPAKPVNFKILNLSKGGIPVEFAFGELDGTDGKFSINPKNANDADIIMFLEPNAQGKLIYTWQLLLNLLPSNGRNPEAGDSLYLYLRKPFLSSDTYRFTMKKEDLSAKLAKDQLKDIRVVPNPYIAAETWEPFNTYSSGRGTREIHFINLPPRCTIRIFNVAGELIAKIEHDSRADANSEITGLNRLTDGSDSGLNNGTAIWNLLSKDNLEISYGIYVYHIQAPGIGEKTGTFAVIK